MPIEGSAVPSEWGQTVWSSRAFLSKQTGMIGVVEKRLKNCIQWIRWSTQRPLCAVRARSAVACWRAVRWGSSAAWRCQRCHIEGPMPKHSLTLWATRLQKTRLCFKYKALLTKYTRSSGQPKLLSSQRSLLWAFIKHWCIVGQWSTLWTLLYCISPVAINGILFDHWGQECNGQTDKE